MYCSVDIPGMSEAVTQHADRFWYQVRAWVKLQRFAENLTTVRRRAQLVPRHRHGGQHGGTIVWIQVGAKRVGAQPSDLGWLALPEPDDRERMPHITRPGPGFPAALVYLSQDPLDPGPGTVG
jgi:hypothetical protein